MNEIEKYNETIFEGIKHTDEFGQEFWYARELQLALEYKEWRKFKGVIEKSTKACEGSNFKLSDNFVGVDKIVKTGVSNKIISDYKLSRYACYLIVQNATLEKK